MAHKCGKCGGEHDGRCRIGKPPKTLPMHRTRCGQCGSVWPEAGKPTIKELLKAGWDLSWSGGPVAGSENPVGVPRLRCPGCVRVTA